MLTTPETVAESTGAGRVGTRPLDEYRADYERARAEIMSSISELAASLDGPPSRIVTLAQRHRGVAAAFAAAAALLLDPP